MTSITTNAMQEDDWASLVRKVAKGNCILMLGPDAVLGTFDGELLPVLVGLARFVQNKLGPDFSYLDASNPSAVAQVAIRERDSEVIQGWVEEFYETRDTESQALRNLAALPFRLIISTAPGLSVEGAFRDEKPGTQVKFYNRVGRSDTHIDNPTKDAPLVYNLYGSLEDSESLILSDSDRVDFLTSVIQGEPPLPPRIRTDLLDPKRPFLFLGFRLNRWQLKVLLRVLTIDGDAQRTLQSFAFELDGDSSNDATKNFYRNGHNIQWFGMSVEEFTSELLHRVQEEMEADSYKNADPELVLPDDAPTVFLCHASEDKEWASTLAATLERNNIGTWLDRNNLRGGDRWDTVIEDAIKNEVDYVVVMQSTSMKDKEKGYVYKEIHLALAHQQYYPKNRHFLIPVLIDTEESKLPDLRDLQSINIAGHGGIDELVREIKRDSYRARKNP